MIEDNHSVCEMMAMFFKKEKWHYEFAYDGVEAEEKFNADPHKWDIILLDLNLPKRMECRLQLMFDGYHQQFL